MRLFLIGLSLIVIGFSALPSYALGEQDSLAIIDEQHGVDDIYHDVDDFLHEDIDGSEYGEVHGDGHEAPQGLPQLDPSSYVSQIFWLLVTFVLMHVVFRYRVIPDLSSAVDRRREQIENDLNAAHSLKAEAERIHNEYEAALAEAREKASSLYARVEEKIKEKEQEEYAKFQEKSVRDIASVELEIVKATKAAMSDMNAVVVDVAVMATQKIVGLSAKEKDVVAVVDSINKKKAA